MSPTVTSTPALATGAPAAPAPLPAPAPALRPAGPGDVPAMAAMINRFASRGLMLPKSQPELYRLFREFVVVTAPDGGVVACGGLRVYSPELAEVVALAVHEDWQGGGLGRRVVVELLDQARGLGIGRVFAMALGPGFFEGLGFRTVPREWIPEKVAADCRGCARRAGCREIAMALELGTAAPEPVGARPARRALRVLQS